MWIDLLSQAAPDDAASWIRLITTGGALTVLAAFGWLVTKGVFRHERELKAKDEAHEREIKAKDAELAYERSERERERKENDVAVDRLQRELNDTNKQLLSVLETGRRSQQLAQRSLELVGHGPPAPDVQQGRP